MKKHTDKVVFLGIDVHKKSYSITTVEGEELKHKTFPASPQALLTHCQRSFPNAKIKSAYEAGFCGFGLHRFLIANGIDSIVVHPASIEVESGNRRKTDKRDSKKIAQQLAANRLESVYVPTVDQENRRSISRLRELFVRQRTRTALQLKSFLNLNSLLSAEETPRVCPKYIKKLLKLKIDENLKLYIRNITETWLYFSKKVKEVEEKLENLNCEEQVLYEAYRKISGFGKKISIILLHELGDTMHFSNEAKLFGFCGLTPSEHSSGEHKRLGHITRQGRPILRKVLVQAAWVAVRKDPYFSAYYEKLSLRVGSCRAIVAVARKLIGKARCVMRKKEQYSAEKAD